jgi:peptidyl-prolyl cis-trans isomerase SurA
MKKILVFFLVLISGSTLSNNSIIAIVNNTPITLNSLLINLEEVGSKSEQIQIINNHIDSALQIQKATQLNLIASNEDLEKVLNNIAINNNISFDELMDLEDFYFIKKELLEKLSILNLQRFITKNLKVPEEKVLKKCSNENSIKDEKQIKVAQIIISEIDKQIIDLDKKNLLINKFLNKLASHIEKGASFEAFAKLHSQHPSYQNGGITNWLPVKSPTLEMLDALGKNEVSKVYKTDFGFAIAIKVDERFISSKLKGCREQLIFNNAKLYYSSWLMNLREQANIEIYYDKLP